MTRFSIVITESSAIAGACSWTRLRNVATWLVGSSAVGTLVGSDASRRARTLAWGVGFPCLLLLGVAYGGLRAGPVRVGRESVATWSGVVFLAMVVFGAWCISIARQPE